MILFYYLILSHFLYQIRSIPNIDFSPLFNENINEIASSNISSEIDSALKTYGLFLISGIEWTYDKNYDNFFSSASSLFDLPLMDKEEVAISNDNFLREYLQMGSESGLKSVFEPKEGYAWGYEWANSSFEKSNCMEVDNIWPLRFNHSNQLVLNKLYSLKAELSNIIAKLITKYLIKESIINEYENDFQTGGDKISLMRLFHYFPSNSVTLSSMREGTDQSLGSSAHTDWGFITIILQDDCGGLQFLHNDLWESVDPLPGSLVVNGGDYLRLLSRGRYISPIHRVLSPIDRERLSFVFFYYPGFYSRIPSALNFLSEEIDYNNNKVQEEYNTLITDPSNISSSIVFGDYVMKKWREVLRSY
jgi:isopenicillin N synthase-like dioxygenase